MKWCFTLALIAVWLGLETPVFAQAHAPDFVRMGTQAFHNKQYDMAISYYNSAIDEDIDYWPAYQALGNRLLHQKKLQGSPEEFSESVRTQSHNEPLRNS